MSIPAAAFHIKPEITVGDILTLITISITLGTLYTAWLQNRRLKEKEMANGIRNACATVLGKLERWQELSLSLFENTQPLYIETSELLARNRNVIQTRDYLWKRLTVARNTLRQSVLEEKLELAYTDLYSYSPKLVDAFMTVIAQLKTAETEVFSDFLEQTQQNVLDYAGKLSGYTSAMLGNDLRDTTHSIREAFEGQTTGTIQPFKQTLTTLLQESDKHLIQKNHEWGFS